MNESLIGSDFPLSPAVRDTLDAVLEIIVPKDPLRGLPSARDVEVLAYLSAHAADYWSELERQLHTLDASARRQFALPFAELTVDERMRVAQLLRNSDPAFLRRLALEAVTCYYQDDRVMTAIGLEPRPPAPKGHEVYAGDFSLVKPVLERGPIWRRTGD
jgi:hypothetical protein